MHKLWLWLVLLAGTSNAISIALDWSNGTPANWFVWVSAIWFSAGVAIVAIRDLQRG